MTWGATSMAEPIRRGYVDTSTGQIHYRHAGERSDCPLLLLHQSPSSSVMYEKLMRQLQQHFWLLAPDTPGFGASDGLPHVSIENFARSMKEFLWAQDVSECFLFGHHTGASIAVQLEHNYPGTAKAISLSGPTLLSDGQKQSLPTSAASFKAREDGSHVLGMWQRIRAKDNTAELDLSLREVLLALHSGDHYQASYKAVVEQDFAGQLPTLCCPVQVFASVNDPLAPAVGPSLKLLQQGSSAAIHSPSASYVCDRDVEEIARVLSDFFAMQHSSF